MKFWAYISDHSFIILIVLITWCLGVLLGGKLGRIRKVIIKHTGKKYPSKIKGNSEEEYALRVKRDFTINLLLKDDKDFPFDNISTFSMQLDNIIKNGKLLDYSIANTSGILNDPDSFGLDNHLIPYITEEDIEDLVTPESYAQ